MRACYWGHDPFEEVPMKSPIITLVAAMAAVSRQIYLALFSDAQLDLKAMP
jgi:hypothetical protein